MSVPPIGLIVIDRGSNNLSPSIESASKKNGRQEYIRSTIYHHTHQSGTPFKKSKKEKDHGTLLICVSEYIRIIDHDLREKSGKRRGGGTELTLNNTSYIFFRFQISLYVSKDYIKT